MQSRTAPNMPRYKCHKEVWALKIKAIEPEKPPDFIGAVCKGSYALGSACGQCERCKWELNHERHGVLGAFVVPEDEGYPRVFVTRAYLTKHDPQPGGYYVGYDDGYVSVSPAEAFEGGYTRLPKYESGFEREITSAINRCSVENESNTPDFILAAFLRACLTAFAAASRAREKWYGKELKPGGGRG